MSNLYQQLLEDQNLYTSLLASSGKDSRLEIPVANELYTNLIDSVIRHSVVDVHSIPDLDLKNNLQSGIYKSNEGKVVCITKIPKGGFKYYTFYATKHFRESEVADGLTGFYLTSFVFDETKTHLMPEGFTYLLLDIEKNDVIPFLAMDSSLPEDLNIYWVFFGMKKFKDDFHCEYDLSKTLDQKEKEILTEKGYFI